MKGGGGRERRAHHMHIKIMIKLPPIWIIGGFMQHMLSFTIHHYPSNIPGGKIMVCSGVSHHHSIWHAQTINFHTRISNRSEICSPTDSMYMKVYNILFELLKGDHLKSFCNIPCPPQ